MIEYQKERKQIFLTNEIWILTNLFRNKRVLCDKWVYKFKRKKYDEILRHKTRWMIRDFEQIERFDYTKTFVLMIKSMNYKTMYVIIAINDWKSNKWTSKRLFCMTKFTRTSSSYNSRSLNKKSTICKLNKTLYDFKQFSRIWFETLIKKICFWLCFIKCRI
jgi:hypothetical protein